MADSNGPVTVRIMGVEYRLRRTEDADYLKKVASGVEGKIKEVSEKHPLVSSDRIAVLSAMQIYDEMLRERGENEKKDCETREKIEELTGLIKAVLKLHLQ